MCLRRQEAEAADHLRDRVNGQLRHWNRVPAELLGELLDRQLPGAGKVVDAGCSAAERGGAHRACDVVVVHQLEGHARIGQHGLEDRDSLEQAQDGPGQSLGDLRVGQAVDQQRRLRAGHDTRAEHVAGGLGAGERGLEQLLHLRLLRRVVVGGGATRGYLLGERLWVLAVEAVGGDR